MSKLFHRRKRNDDDDVESNAGRRASRASKGRAGSIFPDPNLDEYPALDHYISNYREDRRRSVADSEAGKGKKKHWWSFGSSGSEDQDQPTGKAGVSESWLETDLRAGLSSDEVEKRRKVTGWNELTSEKENMFAKFLGFFTGPILYGELRSFMTPIEKTLTKCYSYGSRCFTRRGIGRLGRLWSHCWNPHAQRLCRL